MCSPGEMQTLAWLRQATQMTYPAALGYYCSPEYGL